MLVPSEVVIILSICLIIITMLVYYIYSNYTSSIYTFKLDYPLPLVLNIIKNINNYEAWWHKFNNFYLYKVKHSSFQDDTLTTVRIVLHIHSTSSKEIWNIVLNHSNYGTTVTVSQDLKVLSKLQRIFKNTFGYKQDLINFKKNLRQVLVNKSAAN